MGHLHVRVHGGADESADTMADNILPSLQLFVLQNVKIVQESGSDKLLGGGLLKMRVIT